MESRSRIQSLISSLSHYPMGEGLFKDEMFAKSLVYS